MAVYSRSEPEIGIWTRAAKTESTFHVVQGGRAHRSEKVLSHSAQVHCIVHFGVAISFLLLRTLSLPRAPMYQIIHLGSQNPMGCFTSTWNPSTKISNRKTNVSGSQCSDFVRRHPKLSQATASAPDLSSIQFSDVMMHCPVGWLAGWLAGCCLLARFHDFRRFF